MLVKPNQAIIEWFNKLTPGQRSDAAFFFLAMVKGFSISDLTDTEKMQEDFINFLKIEKEEQPLFEVDPVFLDTELGDNQ